MIKLRMMCWAGHVPHMGEIRNEYKILDRKIKGKRPHRRQRYEEENNTEVELQEIKWEGEDWIHLPEERF